MTAVELYREIQRRDIRLAADVDRLRVDAPEGALTSALRQALAAHKSDLLRLCQAPPADVLSQTACPICGSHERWIWLDGRTLCRLCLILDLAPLTLVRQGWPEDRQSAQQG